MNKKPSQNYTERLKKTLASSSTMMIKPALGSAIHEMIERGVVISRDNLVTHLREQIKESPSITGDLDKELDIKRMSLEATLGFLGESVE